MKKFFVIIFLIFSQLSFSQNDFLVAENYYRQGAYEKAIQLYQKLYNKSPYNTTYLKRLLSCYQETNQFMTAEEMLKSRLQQFPKQTYLLVLLGYNYERQQQKGIAKTYYDKAIASIASNQSFGSIIGRMFKDYNLLDEAVTTYKKLMRLNANANYSFQIAQIYGEQGKFEAMFQSYIAMIDKNENYLNTIQRYMSRYITDDSANENNILLKKVVLRKSISQPKNVWNQILSWLFIQQKEYAKAFIQEKALAIRNPTDFSNMMSLGEVSFQNKAYDTALKCFNYVLEKNKLLAERIEAAHYKVKIAIAQEQPNIEDQFQKMFTVYGKNRATIKLQTTYADYLTFIKSKPNEAQVVLEEAMSYARSKFQKAQLKLKLGDVLVFMGRFNKALRYFSQIQVQLKNHPLAQEARFKVAQTSYFKGDFKWALAQLKVLKGSTTQLIANDAVDLFLTISDQEPKDTIKTGLRAFAKAELMAYQNKNREALTQLSAILKDKELLAINGVQNGDYLPISKNVWFKKGALLTKMKQYKEAIIAYEKVLTIDKVGVLIDDSLYRLANLYQFELKDKEKAKEYYQKIIFDHPSSIYLVDARKQYRKLRGDIVQ